MIDVDKAVIARITRAGTRFEILVDPEKAHEFKEGEIPLDDVVAVFEVFKDASKSEKPSEEELKKAFGTTKFEEIAKIILKKGEVQLTTEQKRKIKEAKENKLVFMISKNAVDPRTHAPHPPQRIKKALEEAKFHIDVSRSVEEQLEKAVQAIRKVLPLKFETDRIAVKVPPQHAGPVAGFLKKYKVMKENWGEDGSLLAVIELPAGLQEEFFGKIGKITHGSAETKVIERI